MAEAAKTQRHSVTQRVRREEIELAAMRSVLRDGFPGASLRLVAKNAGVPLGVIHYYFKNRDELMRRVATRIYNAMIAEMETVRARHSDPRRRIDALLETWLVRATEDWRASLAFVEYWAASVRAGTADRLYTRTLNGFRGILADTLAEARARDPQGTALQLLATLAGYSMFYRTKAADPAERERILAFARKIAQRAIAGGRARMRMTDTRESSQA